VGESADDHDERQASGTGDRGEGFARRDAGDEQEGSAGSSDPAAAFREIEPSEEEVAEIEAERERRLAPENRPENTEIDNTGDNMPEIAKG
jgi:hypothetical protein